MGSICFRNFSIASGKLSRSLPRRAHDKRWSRSIQDSFVTTLSDLKDLFGYRFEIQATSLADGDIVEGVLQDKTTGASVPIVDGIPRFVSGPSYADAFGLQWNIFRSTQLDSRSGRKISFLRFWEGTRWKPRDLYGKHVLEAGSGAGRFTEVMLDAGAKIATFDLSEAVVANRKNNRANGDVTFFQADIYDIPCADAFFDYVFCYGVLQHTPDPDRAFQALVKKIKPGGCISIDFYLKHDRLDPFNQPKYFWRRWTVGMHPEKLLARIRAYMPIWLPIDTFLRRIPYFGAKLLAALRIPCWNYLRSGLTREQRLEWAILDTFDALSARYDTPRTLDEVRNMVAQAQDLIGAEIFYGGNGVIANARRK
jgi:SAM-dependent methyltransferase